MKRLCLLSIAICYCLVFSFTADSQQQKTQPPRGPKASQPAPKAPQSPKASKPEPVKVLVRRLNSGWMALDGVLFLVELGKEAEKAKPGLVESIRLVSGGSIEAEEEEQGRIELPDVPQVKLLKPGPVEWKKAPAGFDLLISWTLDYHERTKSSWSDKLRLDVKETWKVEKVSDSTVTQTWTTSYVLTGVETGASDESEARAAAEQTETVIAPARSPILKEIRAFIEANRTKKAEKQDE